MIRIIKGEREKRTKRNRSMLLFLPPKCPLQIEKTFRRFSRKHISTTFQPKKVIMLLSKVRSMTPPQVWSPGRRR